MKSQATKKLVLSAMFIALAVSLSAFSFPVGASKCFPIQHMINVLSGVFLGPFYALSVAFSTSLIRNLMGTGSLLAFPGSMIGAFCCGMLYRQTKKLSLTYLGEIIGTGILGGTLAYPIAAHFMGKTGAPFTYVVPFLISTIGGTIIAGLLIHLMVKMKAFSYLEEQLH